MSIRWTWHAAKRVLQRDLDPWEVVAAAEACLPYTTPGRAQTFSVGKLVLVLAGNTLVTVMSDTATHWHDLPWRHRNRRKARG